MGGLLPFEAYYENNAGQRLCLSEYPRVITESELWDSAWRLGTAGRPLSEGGRLIRRKRPCDAKTMTIALAGETPGGLTALLDELSAVFEYDLQHERAGKLWVNGRYLLCWCSASRKELSCDFGSTARLTVNVTPEYPTWHSEKRYSFVPDSAASGDGHSYPFAYPKRYGSGMRGFLIENGSIFPAPMRIVFYGAAQNPRLYVGGVALGVNLSLAQGEYAVIDQLGRSVYSVSAQGERTNRFNERIKNGMSFEYAPPGSSVVELSGSGGVEIVLIEQRSEPQWALS